MEKSIIKRVCSKRFLSAILISSSVGTVATQMAKATGISLPEQLNIIEKLIAKGFDASKGILEIIKTYPIPTLLTLTSLTAAILIRNFVRKRRGSNPLNVIYAFHKPKSQKIVVNNPSQQRIRIVAYTSPTFFKEKIDQLFKEMTDIQGTIPLWVRYSMNPLAFSWNLQNVKATHNIHVYGEEAYVKEFLAMLNEEIQTEDKSSSLNVISEDPKVWNENPSTGETIVKNLLPRDLTKSVSKPEPFQNLLKASGILIGLISILLALSFLKRRGARKPDRIMTREKALQTATDCINDFTGKTPTLKHDEVLDDGWSFILSDYQVKVDNEGTITAIRKVIQS